MKILWVVLTGVLVLIWLFFPTIFNWWALNIWHVPIQQIDEIGKLGPLGDIYGSLNTLISSIALCAVAFSTWLQVTSLKETRRVNERQLKLAQDMHDEQINESKKATFSNSFYGLLNYKNDRLKSLVMTGSDESIISGHEVFNKFSLDFYHRNSDFYHENIDEVSSSTIKEDFLNICEKYNNNNSFFEILSYFEIYSSLFDLVHSGVIDISEKDFYISVIRRSMTTREQITLFFLAPMWPRIHIPLKNSYLFNAFYSQELTAFALHFYDESYFDLPDWIKFFESQKEITPA